MTEEYNDKLFCYCSRKRKGHFFDKMKCLLEPPEVLEDWEAGEKCDCGICIGCLREKSYQNGREEGRLEVLSSIKRAGHEGKIHLECAAKLLNKAILKPDTL